MNALKTELRNLQGIRETVAVFEEQVNNGSLLSFSSILCLLESCVDIVLNFMLLYIIQVW